jgi:cytochrome c oxidase assembly factor CtaG
VIGTLGIFADRWALDVSIFVNLFVVAALYLWGVRLCRANAMPWPVRSTSCFLAGLALLAIAYLGPLAAWSHTFFWAHMSQHLIVMMAAAPLLVLGNPITLWFRASSGATRRRIVLPLLRSRGVRWLLNPYFTWALFALVLLGTHFSPFYEWALRNHDADTFIEQPLYLVVALLYYVPLIGANLQPRRPSPAFRLVSLAAMMVPEAIVGAVLYFASRPLYPFYDQVRPFGLAPLPDQQLAGGLMWALVMIVDTGWMMVAAVEWFSDEERRSSRLDRDIHEENERNHQVSA